ncbi:Butyryl-CoA dehydrogenase [Alloactinosynnema sp. L-07]|uniref:acyl-CoA dehydrogenase n=1 Tax=Alloactinosynnema sp. L-07 TaxID=1653480 RepID=UPI00065F0263|nr:acyl-CoA dehydrogenase [Alloactinosynnema sp. L-07]CRK57798.1 Butyryl-CoA dehydrogenase [Alloactinosynnema sp. L-07]
MTLGLEQEHIDLRDSVRAFATRHVSETVVRDAVNAKTEERPPFWAALADQGLLGLHLPEEDGGSGAGLLELAVVVEELGRAMTPGPFLPTVLASAVLAAAGHREHLSGLADGTTTAAVGFGVGSPVLGGQVADLFVLPVEGGWVLADRESVVVTPLDSHDLTRRLASVEVAGHVTALNLDTQLPFDLAAVLFAAEATGLADRNTSTAADYAKVREQFGRPIGRFQGVKHRCARMLARTEQAAACAWDAARAWDHRAPEASLTAAVAAAISIEAGFSTAKDLINTLGGIGFTWEHDASLYLRRAHMLRLLLGSTTVWHQRVARLSLDGVRRTLAVDLPPEADRIRAAIRTELAAAAAAPAPQAWLAEHGYTAPHLPSPWGKDADAVTQLVIAEELDAAGLAPVDMVIGNWVVPTLIEHGDPEQRERLLPGSLDGTIGWCQLFSEPGAGSDLAGLATRAEKIEGGWKVNGQKVWTSMALDAHYGVLLARTDAEVPKHKGISYFVLDMSTPGIDVRPLRELTGEALFNEVFLDDVFIPDEMLVAEPGDGWKLARTTLANERVALSHDSAIGSGERLLSLVDPTDSAQLALLGQILCDAQSAGLLGLRRTIRSLAGRQPGAESSIAKLVGVENIQQVWETCMQWQGPSALVADPREKSATWWFLNSRCLSIAGGTTDVQLNIIGERILGLPRD